MDAFYTLLTTWNRTLRDQVDGVGYLLEGIGRYNYDFLHPLMVASTMFQRVEAVRGLGRAPLESGRSYLELLDFNMELFSRYYLGTLRAAGAYNEQECERFTHALIALLLRRDGRRFDRYVARQKETLRWVMRDYPRAIRDIEPEYGFHFERDPKSLFAETDRFVLRRVLPSAPGVVTDDRLKPVVILPPFVLGSNILSFLPGESKSYAHSFANHGVPTYVRIMKEIHATPAVQTMTLEDDARDTRFFCERVKARHGLPATLNGYCQGGLSAVVDILSGELDGLVDALITCVAPMDGTRSRGLGGFLKELPQAFNDLAYGTKTLANGNSVADGDLMGWVYKLKSIEQSGPMVALLHDMMLGAVQSGCRREHSKTVAALNYWLQNERSDIPLSVTRMSFDSYTTPVAEDGTLPIQIFGNKINFRALAAKKIPWLLCYGETDDLVEKEVALAPRDFLDVEVTPFPKGHVAIATSWSHPDSRCAIDTAFGEARHRGPVRFHLDLAKSAGQTADR